MPTGQLGATGRQAKNRLSDIITAEVSLVDLAANVRRFVIAKSQEMGSMSVKKDDGTAASQAPAAMPNEAKQALLKGIGGLVDKMSALAKVVGDAPVDEKAPVPKAIGEMLKDVGTLFMGFAKQYGDAGEEPTPGTPPVEGDAAKAQKAASAHLFKAELDAYTAMTATINAAQSRMWNVFDTLSEDPTKGIDELKAIVDMLENAASLGNQASSGAAPAAPEPEAAAKRAASVAKAGKKLATARLKTLKEAVDTLAGLLKEVSDAEETDEAAKAAGGATPTQKSTSEMVAANTTAIQDLMKTMGDKLDVITKAVADPKLPAEVDKRLTENKELVEKALKGFAEVARSTGGSNLGAIETPVSKEAGASAGRLDWEDDMSAAVVRKNATNPIKRIA